MQSTMRITTQRAAQDSRVEVLELGLVIDIETRRRVHVHRQHTTRHQTNKCIWRERRLHKTGEFKIVCDGTRN